MKACPKCGTLHERKTGTRIASYCATCHAAHMRATRPKHSELSPQDRARSNARSYANVYQKRGKLARQPCEQCGCSTAEKHHPDYSKPLAVQWLCKPCHVALHKAVERSHERRPI